MLGTTLKNEINRIRLNEAVRRVLAARIKAGQLDAPEKVPWHSLKQDVILTGVDNRIEVWSKENWNRYNGEVEPDVTAIAASLSELGI